LLLTDGAVEAHGGGFGSSLDGWAGTGCGQAISGAEE